MKKNIAWKEEDIRCWLLRVEIFEIVPEKASLRRSRCFCGDLKEVREPGIYKAIQCFWTFSMYPSRLSSPFSTQFCALGGWPVQNASTGSLAVWLRVSFDQWEAPARRSEGKSEWDFSSALSVQVHHSSCQVALSVWQPFTSSHNHCLPGSWLTLWGKAFR